jgi:hypothetical protein|tara:strand:- start:61 stop:348 length:288 start_codon:yes stop_codon:yes gene_type:complete
MKTWNEVSPRNGLPIEEDAPTNSAGGGAIAGLGVDHPDYPGSGEPGKKKKKKDTLIDGRTKSYRQHRAKLETARIKRMESKKSRFVESIVKNETF